MQLRRIELTQPCLEEIESWTKASPHGGLHLCYHTKYATLNYWPNSKNKTVYIQRNGRGRKSKKLIGQNPSDFTDLCKRELHFEASRWLPL